MPVVIWCRGAVRRTGTCIATWFFLSWCIALGFAWNLSIPDLLQYFRLWVVTTRIQIQENTEDIFAWRRSPSGSCTTESTYKNKILCQSRSVFLLLIPSGRVGHQRIVKFSSGFLSST